MKTLDRQEAQKEWGKFWNELKEEWFKVEVLQDYSGEDMGESLQAWLKGDKERSMELIILDGPIKDWAKSWKNNPVKKIRVHVVSKPYTPYLEWEIEVYKQI